MLRLVGSAAEWTDVRIFATRLLLASGRGRKNGRTKKKRRAPHYVGLVRGKRIHSGLVYKLIRFREEEAHEIV